ncbi:hypothetical protein ACIA5C_10295 [Actinoplanes sp. NPDC051343]|uniref:hypothetical protein n=1 Tax=Actinoplanes sp. NPDC051343 TaxID=3363906 RepID=UPI003790D816
MTKVLLSLHVLAAIVAIGPVTVAASMFPAALRRSDRPAMATLHRICRVYAALGILVPVLGLATAGAMGVLGSAWLLTSLFLTIGAAVVLGFLVLPAQAAALAAPAESLPARLGMTAGLFNLMWAVVVVLMVVRPGSTTGA